MDRQDMAYEFICGQTKNKELAVIYVMYDEYELLKKFIDKINSQIFRDFDLIVVVGYKAEVHQILSYLKRFMGNFIVLKRKCNNGPSGGFFIGHCFAYANNYQKIVSVEADCYPKDRFLLKKISGALETNDATFCYHQKTNVNYGMWIFSGIRRKTLEIAGTTAYWIFILWDDVWLQTVIKKLGGVVFRIKKIKTNIVHLADIPSKPFLSANKHILKLPYLTARNDLAALVGAHIYAMKKIIAIKIPFKAKLRVLLKLLYDPYLLFVYISITRTISYIIGLFLSKDIGGMKMFMKGYFDGLVFNVNALPPYYLTDSNVNWTLRKTGSVKQCEKQTKKESTTLIEDLLITLLSLGFIRRKNYFNVHLKSVLVSKPEIIIGREAYAVEQQININLSRFMFLLFFIGYIFAHFFIFFFVFFNGVKFVQLEQNDVTKFKKNFRIL